MHKHDKAVIDILRGRANDSAEARKIKRLLIVTDSCDVEQTEDGGKGSGNWGHKGRPGKRGGSGAGGGKHNREGSKETGFTRKAAPAPAAPAKADSENTKAIREQVKSGSSIRAVATRLNRFEPGTQISYTNRNGEKETLTKQEDRYGVGANWVGTNASGKKVTVTPEDLGYQLKSGADFDITEPSSAGASTAPANKNPNPHVVEGKKIDDNPEQQEAVDFVYSQTGVDLNKYRDSKWLTQWEKASSEYYKAPTVELDWKRMPREDQRAIENLARAYGGKYDLVDTSAWSKALVWKGGKGSATAGPQMESSSAAPEPNRDKYGNPNTATGDPNTDFQSLKSLFQFREKNKNIKARNTAATKAIRGILDGMEPGTVLKRKDGIAAGNLMKNADGTWTPVDNNGKVLRYQFGQPVKYGPSYAAQSAQTDMYLESIQYPSQRDSAPTFTGFSYPV